MSPRSLLPLIALAAVLGCETPWDPGRLATYLLFVEIEVVSEEGEPVEDATVRVTWRHERYEDAVPASEVVRPGKSPGWFESRIMSGFGGVYLIRVEADPPVGSGLVGAARDLSHDLQARTPDADTIQVMLELPRAE